MARSRKRSDSAISIDITIAGVSHMKELLDAMPQQMRTGILQPIVATLTAQGAKFAKEELRRVLPKRARNERRWDTPTGALEASLGGKVVPPSRMRNRNLVYGLYGARMDFRVNKGTAGRIAALRNIGLRARVVGPVALGRIRRSNGRTNTSSGSIQPHKYIHFVERGHQKGRGPVEAEPYPFMGPARNRLESVMPGIVRARWAALYPQQMEKLKRRYMRRSEIKQQIDDYARKHGYA